MNLGDLRDQFRSEAGDKSIAGASTQHYLFPDEDVDRWLNEAQEEAAERASLIKETSNPAICEIDVDVDEGVYPLHDSVIVITNARFTVTGETDYSDVHVADREELDRIRPLWRTTSEPPRDLIQDETQIVLGCLPSEAGLLQIECFRLPLQSMTADEDVPEIHRKHHRQLVHWAIHKAFSQPDTETRDPNRAATAEAAFTAYFGAKPDATQRRDMQINRPQVNKAYF
jgi:hypothetical protein